MPEQNWSEFKLVSLKRITNTKPGWKIRLEGHIKKLQGQAKD